MNKNVLANNIAQLSEETLHCVKLMERAMEIFTFDTETQEDLDEFLSIMRIKAIRIASPRNKKDITDNIRRKEVYENWQTTEWFSDLYNNQQDI